jgi:hypothetical protein
MDTTYSRIIPQQIQEELIALRDRTTADAWRLGDLVEIVTNYCKDNKLMVTDKVIHRAIGAFCGRAARTIREFSYLSNFYPPEIREVYSVLAMDHFRLAATFGEKWRQVLDWAVERTDELGRPATVDACYAHFVENSDWKQEEIQQQYESASEQATMLDERTPFTKDDFDKAKDAYQAGVDKAAPDGDHTGYLVYEDGKYVESPLSILKMTTKAIQDSFFKIDGLRVSEYQRIQDALAILEDVAKTIEERQEAEK